MSNGPDASTRQQRALVVEDERAVRAALTEILEGQGFAVTGVEDGAAALAAIGGQPLDLVLLDLGLPDTDGLEVLGGIRERSDVPVLILSGHAQQEQKIRALDAGADDYLTKPFDVRELLARVRAVLRRRPDTPAQVTAGDLVIDLDRREVRRGGRPVRLTPTELGLLTELVTNPGTLLTHDHLLRSVWGKGYGSESHYLRVYVAQLRRKLGDDASRPRLIRTEAGMGYRWVAEQA
jgi:two-component system KDP operon response regulator KdpE